MTRPWLAVLLAVGAPVAAHAQLVFEVSSNAAIVGDCASTIHNLKISDKVEDNPLLGFHPRPIKVVAWCGVAIAANEGLVRWLFPGDRRAHKIIWALVTALELWKTEHNL